MIEVDERKPPRPNTAAFSLQLPNRPKDVVKQRQAKSNQQEMRWCIGEKERNLLYRHLDTGIIICRIKPESGNSHTHTSPAQSSPVPRWATSYARRWGVFAERLFVLWQKILVGQRRRLLLLVLEHQCERASCLEACRVWVSSGRGGVKGGLESCECGRLSHWWWCE